MFNKLKEGIKKIGNKKIEEIKKHQNQSQQILFDYAQISNLFPEAHFIPLTSWSISPSTILHILNDIIINKRNNVVEFGCGASTLYVAKLIQTFNLDIKFYSVESNEKWMNKIQEDLSFYNLDHLVHIIYAPLKTAPAEICLNNQELWYDTQKISGAFAKDLKFDLVIVDGPLGSITPFARYSAVPFLKDKLGKSFGIFLDDVKRKNESKIVDEWANILDLQPRSFSRHAFFTNDKGYITTPFLIK